MEGIHQANEANKPILLLRIWHSFKPEELQNVDVKGNDLMTLPNILAEDLNAAGGKRQLNYVDKLLEASTIEPTAFIYSGALSAQQKQMFEDLYETAAQKGGNLYVLCYEDYFKEEINKQTSLLKSDLPRAEFIDFQRLFILRNQGLIFSAIEKKYGSQLETQGVFYSDFDNSFLEDLKHVKSVVTDKIRVPILSAKINDKKLDESYSSKETKLALKTNNIRKRINDIIKDLNTKCDRLNKLEEDENKTLPPLEKAFKEFGLKAEINSIFYPRDSQFLNGFLNKPEGGDHKWDPENYGGFRFFLERELGKEILALALKGEKEGSIKSIRDNEGSSCTEGKETIKRIVEELKLPSYQGCKDRLWMAPVSTLILKDHRFKQGRAEPEFEVEAGAIRAHNICEVGPASTLTDLEIPEGVGSVITRSCS